MTCTTHTETLKDFCGKLDTCRAQIKKASASPGPLLSQAMLALMDTASTYAQGEGGHSIHICTG